MANERGRQDHYEDRGGFEDRRRGRQPGGDYGRSWQQDAGGPRQEQRERFSDDFGLDERSDDGSLDRGRLSDDDFRSRQSGYASGTNGDYRASGGQRGSRQGRLSGERNYGSRRGDDLANRGSPSGAREHADWQDRDRWQDHRGYGERYAASGSGQGYREGERDFWDKAGDEVSSWFGDEDARRRRDMDRHRGRGPRNYARSDERIREDVNDRLTDDGFLDATEIECSVTNREVTLSGSVDSRQAKRRAEDLAESVSGVTHVQNNLRVRRDDTAAGSTASSTASFGSGKATGM